MKYQVITNAEGYVQLIRHTGSKLDFVELNLEDYDFSEQRLYAYKLGKNELIFDKSKWEEIKAERQKIENQKEISYLQGLLNDTDYIIARWGEEIIALDNPLTWISDVIKINVRYATQYKEKIKNRKTWRERIEELQGK